MNAKTGFNDTRTLFCIEMTNAIDKKHQVELQKMYKKNVFRSL